MKRPAQAIRVSIHSFIFRFHSKHSFKRIHQLISFHVCWTIAVAGGLTLREGIRIIDKVFKTGRLCGLDVVEVCPNIGDARDLKTTVDSAIQLISAATGNNRSGNLPPTQEYLPKNWNILFPNVFPSSLIKISSFNNFAHLFRISSCLLVIFIKWVAPFYERHRRLDWILLLLSISPSSNQ